MANIVQIILNGKDLTGGVFQKGTNGLVKMKSAATQLAKAGVLMGTAVGGALTLITKNAIDTADLMSKFSKVAGLSVEEFSRLAFASKLAAVDLNAFREGMVKFNRSIIEAAGNTTSKQAKAFKVLQISIRDASGQIKDNRDLLDEVSDKFRSYADGAGKSAIAMEIMGKSGARMIPLLNEGSEGLRKLGDQTIGVTRAMAVQSERFNDQLNILKQRIFDFGTLVAKHVLPNLIKLGDQTLKETSNMEKFEEAAIFVANAFKHTIVAVTQTVAVFRDLQAITGHFAEVTVAAIISGVDALKRTFTSFTDQMSHNVSALKAFWSGDLIGGLKAAGAAQKAAGTNIKEEWDSAMKTIRETNSESWEQIESEIAERALRIGQIKATLLAPSGTTVGDLPGSPGQSQGGKNQLPGIEQEVESLDTLLERLNKKREIYEAYKGFVVNSFLQMKIAVDNFAASSLRSFSDGMSTAIANIVTGTQKAGEAFKALGLAMVQSLVKFAAQMVINTALAAILGSTAAVASTGQAALVAAAWATPAALVNAATFGAGATAGNIALASSVAFAKGLAVLGQAHDGLDFVPRTGTYILERGEAVVPKERNTGEQAVTVNVMLNDEVLASSISRSSRNGRLTINARAVT